MMIACESCQSKYSVADEKIRGKTVKIRCRECQTMMVATGPVATPAPAPAVVPAPAPAPASVAPAAVVKRGGARPNRDFFAEASQEVVSAPPPVISNATAQRNENSCLFTLAGLTRKPFMDLPKEAETTTVNSGLIDLKSMTANAGRKSSNPSVVEPLFGSAPPLGMTIEVPEAPPPRSRRGLFIGMGAVVMVLAVVGLGFGMKGGTAKAPAASAVVEPAPLPPPTPTVEPAAPKDPVTDTAGTPSASASGKVATTAGGKGGKGGKRGGAGGKASTTSPKAPKTSKPATASGAKPKGNDACGCNGELMCLMRCSK